MKTRWLLSLAALLLLPSIAAACPGCKEAVGQTNQGLPDVARGFDLTIMFMAPLPFAILGVVGGVIWRATALAAREQLAKQIAPETRGETPPGTRGASS